MAPNYEATLIFIGGFDKPASPYNPLAEISFLGLMYPCSDLNMLKEKIGTLDLTENNPHH